MQNMKSRDFRKILIEYGFHEVRRKGSHVIFERTQSISAPLTSNEISGPMAARLLKEVGIVLK